MNNFITIIIPYLQGTAVTLSIFAITLLISLPLGFCVTLMLNSKNKVVAYLADTVVYVIRGTPLLLQLLFVYFGLPLIPFIGKYLTFSRFTAACIAFSINYACYFGEIFRGGLLSIDAGQYEASKVLGLTPFENMIHVIIPQMIRVCLPSISNETITLVKDTALVTVIGVAEVLHFAKTAVNREGTPFPFVYAAVIYLIINFVITMVFKYLEKHYEQ